MYTVKSRLKPAMSRKRRFKIQYGHFKYLIILFRLTNAPATFQAYINKALSGMLDTIYIVYLNNIIVYFNNYKVYTHHM